MKPDDVVLAFPDRVFNFVHTKPITGWRKRVIFWGAAEQSVRVTVKVRTLSLRELIMAETTLDAVNTALKKEGSVLDLQAACFILFGKVVRDLPRDALDQLWKCYQELNYPKVETEAAKDLIAMVKPPASEPSSESSSDGPSTSESSLSSPSA